MPINWTNRRLFWVLNLGAVVLAFVAMTHHIGGIIAILLGLSAISLLFNNAYKRHVRRVQTKGERLEFYLIVFSN